MLSPIFMIRKMTIQDLDQIMLIEKEAFSLPWSRQAYENELKNQYATYFVLDMEGCIGAYGGIWVVFDEAHITNVAVAVKYRGSGCGKTLMKELEKSAIKKGADRILLEVRPSNLAALNMYSGLGYKATGLRKQYYSDNGEDAVIMTKFLL